MNEEPKPKTRSRLHYLFRHQLALESETSWFLLLGVLDMVLTTVLLNTGVAREANPVARYFLFAGGLRGMVGYKCVLLAVTAVATQIIVMQRPRTAKAILCAGIVLQLVVVAYSVLLLLKVAG